MFRTTLTLLALVPALVLGHLACVGAGVQDEGVVQEEESAIAVLNPDLIGTFRGVKLGVGDLALLTLKSDGTYHRGSVVACVTAPCYPTAEDGAFMVGSRDGHTYLALYPEDRSAIDRYQYAFREGTLRLKRMADTSGQWFSMIKSEGAAWCDEDNDCHVQNLPEGPCATDWYCAANVCAYSCLPHGPAE